MAPSPTGFFHVGSARTALYNWLFARHHKGQFILRIEDTDAARSSEEMIDVIKDGLRWLNIDWDEEYCQSQRLQHYTASAQQLLDAKKAYYCYCRPEDLQQEKQAAYREKKDWRYDRRCLRLSPAERAEKERAGISGAVRFLVPEHPVTFHDVVLGDITRESSNIEDFIILRADGTPTYNFACVIDDHDMEITHVIRGADHVTNTPKQILMYEALGFDQPVFAHLPLILGKDKAKLSKRHGAVSLMEYRDMGFLPQAIFNYLALLGWSPGDDKELFMLQDKMNLGEFDREGLIKAFSIDRINKANAVFDMDKLMWMNQQYIHEMNHEKFKKRLKTVLSDYNLLSTEKTSTSLCRNDDLFRILQPRLKTFGDIISFKYFFTEDFEYDEKALNKYAKTESINYVKEYLDIIKHKSDDEFDAGHLEGELRYYAKEKNISPAKIIHPLRVFLTGTEKGAGLFETMEYIGKERCISRIQKIITEKGAHNA